jgi:hypothetical protein
VYGAAATCGAACPAACRNRSTPRCGGCGSASSAPVTRCTMSRKVAASVLMYVVGARLDGRGRRRFPAYPPAGPSRHRADKDGDATPVGVQSVTATAPCISIAVVAVVTRPEVRRADGAKLASTGDSWDVGLAASLGGVEEAWARWYWRSDVDHWKLNLSKFSGPCRHNTHAGVAASAVRKCIWFQSDG